MGELVDEAIRRLSMIDVDEGAGESLDRLILAVRAEMSCSGQHPYNDRYIGCEAYRDHQILAEDRERVERGFCPSCEARRQLQPQEVRA